MSNIVIPRPQKFSWAFEKSANLKEPFEELKKEGWRYGDIPTAANFNYLFNEVGKWHEYLEHRIDGAQDDISTNYEAFLKLKSDLKEVIIVLKIAVDILQKNYPNHYWPKLPDL